MSDPALRDLIAGYIDGDLDAGGRERLAEALGRDAAGAAEFDEALRLEALLAAAHCEAPAVNRIRAAVRARLRPRRRSWWVPAFAAACLLAAAAGVWLGLRDGERPAVPPPPVPTRPDNEVQAGSVRLAGNPLPVGEIPNGSEIEVDPGGPAFVRLSDGSHAELAAASRAVLHGPVGEVRQVLRLEKGKGTFTAEKAARQFRVDTPVGRVTVTGTKFSVELRKLRPKGEGKMKVKLGLAMAVAVMAGSVSVEYDGRKHTLAAGESRVFGGEGESPREGGLPEGVRGFSGKVRGVVVAKGEKHTFTFKVGRVLQTWRGNKARRPQALVGRTVTVGPRWHKTERGWRPVALHVAFIRKLKPGHEFTIEIANFEGNHFSILELGEEQRKWAMQGAEGEGGEQKEGEKKEGEHREGDREGGKHEGGEGALPAGVVGFSGSVRGVVVAKSEKGFTFKVGRVLRTWEGSKAPRPNDLAGMTVKVGPRWEKRRGKWRPIFAHVVFINHVVKPGMEMNLEIKHAERDVFMILELGGDQRAMVEKLMREMREKHHREKREGEKREGEKKEGAGGDWDF